MAIERELEVSPELQSKLHEAIENVEKAKVRFYALVTICEGPEAGALDIRSRFQAFGEVSAYEAIAAIDSLQRNFSKFLHGLAKHEHGEGETRGTSERK